MANSAYLRDLVLERTLLDETALPNKYLSLHSGDPADVGRAELRGNEYLRQRVQLVRTATGVAANQQQVEIDGLPAAVITHFGIWDAQLAGNFLTGGQLAEPQRVISGQAIRWNAGDLLLSVG